MFSEVVNSNPFGSLNLVSPVIELEDGDVLRESVMLAHLLQNPRDWYVGNVQFPVGHSIMMDLLFGV